MAYAYLVGEVRSYESNLLDFLRDEAVVSGDALVDVIVASLPAPSPLCVVYRIERIIEDLRRKGAAVRLLFVEEQDEPLKLLTHDTGDGSRGGCAYALIRDAVRVHFASQAAALGALGVTVDD